jgi:protein phosphatase
METRRDLLSHGLTDVGLARANNEDVWVALPQLGFYALADGMGGHKAGEVAAREVVEDLCRSMGALFASNPKSYPDLMSALRAAIERANRRVFEMGNSSQAHNGMGTTLCCLLWIEDAVIYAHVGDSRIYRFRGGSLQPLTRDHSLLARWLSYGKVAEECETPFPYKNVITRAVGTSRRANPEIAVATAEPGDLFLLCSDGLTDALSEIDIEKILSRSDTLPLAAARLIEKAKIKGSSDNITVLLVQAPYEEDLSRQQRHDTA